jgi:tetratricopeptide (TPR) repeat protein
MKKRGIALAAGFFFISHILMGQSPDIYYSLGVTLLNDTNYSEAITCFDKVIEHNDRDVGALTLRGFAKMKEGEYRQAMEDFNRVIRIDPDIPSAWNHRGLCKKELRNYRGALSDFSWALQLDPKNKEAYFNRAVVKYFHLKDPDGGCSDWQKSASLGYPPSQELLRKYCSRKTGETTSRK